MWLATWNLCDTECYADKFRLLQLKMCLNEKKKARNPGLVAVFGGYADELWLSHDICRHAAPGTNVSLPLRTFKRTTNRSKFTDCVVP